MQRHLAIGLGFVLAAGAAEAQELGNVAAGQALATQWCSECHIVSERRQQLLPMKPPSFFTIANRVEVTPVWLATFFRTPHAAMPNFILTPTQRDDVSAFILSLKSR